VANLSTEALGFGEVLSWLQVRLFLFITPSLVKVANFSVNLSACHLKCQPKCLPP